MIPGLSGRLISGSFAADHLAAQPFAQPMPSPVRRAVERWAEQRTAACGPASSTQALADGVTAPLLRLLGYDVLRQPHDKGRIWLHGRAGDATLPCLVVSWQHDLASGWRDSVLAGLATDARWCACSNGAALRLFDAHRTWCRDYLEIELDALGASAALQDVCWTLLRATAFAATPAALDAAVALSARHGVDVCQALGAGVLKTLTLLIEAMADTSAEPPSRLFEQSLTVVYCVLFLLFAEARALVPVWHPIYRDHYTIDAIVSTLLEGRRSRGIWAAVQAISRLAHAGCAAGELKVTAFNGRLFAPADAAAFERRRIADSVMARALLSLATTRSGGAVARIRYRDLDVEQLGAVYEKVLEYEPRGHETALTRDRDGRKATGTFYTPRPVTAFLVRRTLQPLIAGRSADEILRLRVLDPAMGSGAFLVAACRYLASAVEEALIGEGRWHPGDITAADRAALRRDVAQRCLYGVDMNPVAVQLARLSIWLATLAADKPLTFLDHHLAAGNSLVGASIEDFVRQPGGGGRHRGRQAPLPLFDDAALATSMGDAVARRLRMETQPENSADDVRGKERELATLQDTGSTLGRWKRVLDLWCAGWFCEDRPIDAALAGELATAVLRDQHTLPRQAVDRWLTQSDTIAASQGFFHWPVAFPEVFRDERGDLKAGGGFDALIGNPPWDMVRGDAGDAATRALRRDDARHLTAFVRGAGIYRVEAQSHVNRYALFLERAFQLVRPHGRIGLVLPGGLLTDVGTAALRRHLFDCLDVDEITGLDNRGGIFPIHRSVRFVLLSCTAGSPTTRVACRFGVSNPDHLEAPDALPPIELTRAFLTRLSGADDMGVPELHSPRDLQLLEQISAMVPRLGDDDGWNVRFGRELNASDDRGLFEPLDGASGRPVLEGKQIEPFRTAVEGARYQLRAGAQERVPRRPRLAYRDVASATNRLTLTAAVVPARAVTTHTLFCLRNPLPPGTQHVLCALLNSFVANYLIRFRVNTHVTATLMSKLRIPVVAQGSAEFIRLAFLARTLAESREPVEGMREYVELQAQVAKLYGLGSASFEHILSTFPLIPEGVLTECSLRLKDLR